jgi:hypothetical protein
MLDANASRRGLSTSFPHCPWSRSGGTEHLRRPVVGAGRLTPAALSPTVFRSRLSCGGQVRTSMPDFESPCARVERSSEDNSSIAKVDSLRLSNPFRTEIGTGMRHVRG